jgi:hypothetical protein
LGLSGARLALSARPRISDTWKGYSDNEIKKWPCHSHEPTPRTATATLVDKYAPEYVDKLDEQKMTYDEKAELVNVGAWA